MRTLIALLWLIALPAYADCPPAVQRDLEIVLPGRIGPPPTQQMRTKVPVTLAPGDCPAREEVVVDPLHGAPRAGGLLRGEGDGQLLNPKPVRPETP